MTAVESTLDWKDRCWIAVCVAVPPGVRKQFTPRQVTMAVTIVSALHIAASACKHVTAQALAKLLPADASGDGRRLARSDSSGRGAAADTVGAGNAVDPSATQPAPARADRHVSHCGTSWHP